MSNMDEVARQLGADMSNLSECTCAELRQHLHELLDQELSSGDLVRLKAHAENCETCSEAAQAEAHLRRIIKRSCCQEAPPTLREKVVTRISTARLTW